MNINFRKEKNSSKKNNLQEKISTNIASYCKFVYEFVLDKLGRCDDEFKKQQSEDYIGAVNYMVDYMRNNIKDTDLDGKHALDIELENVDFNFNSVLYLLRFPKYNSLIYILDNLHSPHIHLNEGIIEEAENIETLPNLNNRLRAPWINKIFTGLNIMDAKCLLQQMNLLPEGNQLDKEIQMYNEMIKQHNNFLESIICMLLSSKSRYDVIRARLLADSFSLKFDFSPYDSEDIAKEKKFKKTDC